MKQLLPSNFVIIALIHFGGVLAIGSQHSRCQQSMDTEEPCEHQLVQSMPDGLDLSDSPGTTTIPTHKSLIDMADEAKESLSIVSFYWWLTAPKEFDGHPSVEPGKQLMQSIERASNRGVRVEVVLDHSGRKDMNNPDDLAKLEQFAVVTFLNMTHLLKAGVVHSKFMIADNRTFYVGSSNFDWRSYTQIKEIGVTFKDCPKLAQDLDKIFRTYKFMAGQDTLPDDVSDDLKTKINILNPLELADFKVFMGAAPIAFNGQSNQFTNPTGRSNDIDGLLGVIARAKHRIDISVMNYSPRFEFGYRRYWPVIDDALRRAATERRVRVRLLFSNWTNTKPTEPVWYRSLNALQSPAFRGGGIHVKFFRVPAFDEFQRSIPFARVKHDKYMVTDKDLYIGTSNWTPDYFTDTCGVGVVIQPKDSSGQCGLSQDEASVSAPKVVQTMQAIFERDFNSQYAHELDHDDP